MTARKTLAGAEVYCTTRVVMVYVALPFTNCEIGEDLRQP